ncbi:adenylosuccinate lyase [Campylobacter sp. MIT 12-8780]|uniref:adenylosuccinate lyase n=1 Tax=unclassified Campylobacter TaxID=2593542 RepID=UPI0010F7C2BA|nr:MULTISPECIES: adenylosuccinate lyase [unclassified Campylobacter]NDJ26939.1 adenylosuccinate lyase [Campylobacter sp. MIT 19-121]TKX29105.1 adenylosuccinate lyase [Campylobacter sp. MIT 12-5580]TQR41919.1 adenylosuccinate lyase [Campylobacter sp. MIT 12-8780]
MQIVQSLGSISVHTDDISVFHYFKNLIKKNFSKVLGKKDKIFSFFQEDEIPQRKYFLKLLEKRYKESVNGDLANLSEAYHKTFKLNFKQENTLKPVIFVKIEFMPAGFALKLSSNEKLFISYIKQYFKDHECEYKEESQLLIISYKDKNTLALFEEFASTNEHLKYCIDFDVNEEEYENFKHKVQKKEDNKWKFNALAKLFSSYFQVLECSPENDLNQIRQKYLVLVKLYHPDFYHGKSMSEIAQARVQFEKIQIAYDNLKALYKNNA